MEDSINPEHNHEQFINESFKENIKSEIKSSKVQINSDIVDLKSTDKKHDLLKTASKVLVREVEAEIEKNTGTDLTDRVKDQTSKYGYKGMRYTVLGTRALTKKYHNFNEYKKNLSNDVATGLISNSESKKELLLHIGKSSINEVTSISKIIKKESIRAIEDFRGSDDLGMQAITKPKDAIVKARRSYKITAATGKSIYKTAQNTQHTLNKVQNTVTYIYSYGKKAIQNPVFLKSMGAIAGILILFSLISTITISLISIFPSLSLKSEGLELTKTYQYITKLDATMEDQILKFKGNKNIDRFHYYLNSSSVSESSMKVITNADLLLMFFDSKYEDYSFELVKDEIDSIHKSLYELNTKVWKEKKGKGETIYHLDIYLSTSNVEDYIKNNLTAEELDSYKVLEELGPYTMRSELKSPFDIDWSRNISCRFGFRIHPIKHKLSNHKGVDIAMPNGTPIKACMTGKAIVPSFSNEYGNYVKIIDDNGDYTLYAHMSNVAVSNGTTITDGQVIGYVGSTGSSTGNHLHLEYHKDGHVLNPTFFLERVNNK